MMGISANVIMKTGWDDSGSHFEAKKPRMMMMIALSVPDGRPDGQPDGSLDGRLDARVGGQTSL